MNSHRKVKNKLYKQVGGVCSLCEKVTIGPNMDSPDDALSVGDAAHIHAAAENGPRYKRSMTTRERKSENNGIWLCVICARIIDRERQSYPADKLFAIKKKAIRLARNRVGKRLPSEEDILKPLAAIYSTDIVEFIYNGDKR